MVSTVGFISVCWMWPSFSGKVKQSRLLSVYPLLAARLKHGANVTLWKASVYPLI